MLLKCSGLLSFRYNVSFPSGGSVLGRREPAGTGSEVHAAEYRPAVFGDGAGHSGSDASVGTCYITTMAGRCQSSVMIINLC